MCSVYQQISLTQYAIVIRIGSVVVCIGASESGHHDGLFDFLAIGEVMVARQDGGQQCLGDDDQNESSAGEALHDEAVAVGLGRHKREKRENNFNVTDNVTYTLVCTSVRWYQSIRDKKLRRDRGTRGTSRSENAATHDQQHTQFPGTSVGTLFNWSTYFFGKGGNIDISPKYERRLSPPRRTPITVIRAR